jgi:hypothetical protein
MGSPTVRAAVTSRVASMSLRIAFIYILSFDVAWYELLPTDVAGGACQRL